MVKISDLDEYLHADAVENGDVVEITGKARQISQEETAFERTYLEIPVKLSNGRNKVWTPSTTSLKALAKVFGDDATGGPELNSRSNYYKAFRDGADLTSTEVFLFCRYRTVDQQSYWGLPSELGHAWLLRATHLSIKKQAE